MNIANGLYRIVDETGCRVLFGRLDDVDEVMTNAALLVQRHFVGADVEASVNGCRIAADNLAAMTSRELDGERALPRGCWT